MPPALEIEIKQPHFKSLQQKAMINLIYTSGVVTEVQSRIFREYGLTSSQFNILRILRGQHPNPATVSLLVDRMLDKTSNASRIVERLRKKDLVTRTQNAEDRRQVDVHITEEGLDLLNQLDDREKELGAGFSSLSSEELNHFNQLLNKLRENTQNQNLNKLK